MLHDLPGASSSLILHKSEFDEDGHWLEMFPSEAVPRAPPGGSVSACDEVIGGGQLHLSW